MKKNYNILGYKLVIERKETDLDKDIDKAYYRSIPSITDSITAMAHEQTMDYIRNYVDLSNIVLCDNRWNNLDYCVKKAMEVPGLFLECGVYTARSINFIARRLSKNKIYGFDSFEGLPNNWDGFNMLQGHFNLRGHLPKVCDNVILYKGWFDKTLPLFFKHNKEKLAFLHIDCDIYESTKTVLEIVYPYLQPKTILVFDEYFNYPNWQNHEFRAFQEFVKQKDINYRYISFGKLQVGIEIVKLGENS